MNKSRTRKNQYKSGGGSSILEEKDIHRMLRQYNAATNKQLDEKIAAAAVVRAKLEKLALDTNTKVTDTNTKVTDTHTVTADNQSVLKEIQQKQEQSAKTLRLLALPKQQMEGTIEKQRRDLLEGDQKLAQMQKKLDGANRQLLFAARKNERQDRMTRSTKQGRGKAAFPALGSRGTKASVRHPKNHGKHAREKKSKSKNSKAFSPKMSPK